MGKIKYYILVIVILFGLLIVLDGGEKKPINWTPSYSVYDKVPLGLYVLNKEIDSVSGLKIHRFSKTPYEFLDSVYDTEKQVYTRHGAILNISGQNGLDQESLKEIFYFVAHGNTAFLSMESFPKIFKDSLKIETSTYFAPTGSLRLGLANSKLGKKSYRLREGMHPIYFSSMDTLHTTVLGSIESDSLRPNFVKVKYRNGEFVLHTSPAAFTNFHLLKGDHFEYAQKALAYLPEGDVYWYVSKDFSSISNSKLRYISSQPALKWAWYLLILGILAFMVFNGRRKQRVVPILDPLPNTTVEFAKTIGNLYFQQGDHHLVIDRKIVYFLEKIRNEYHLDTSKLDEQFVSKLHQKSGKPIADIENAVFLINNHRRNVHWAVEQDLILINRALEKIT